MKRFLSILTLMAAVLGLTVLMTGCAKPEAPPTASVPTPEATPDVVAIETELLKIENDWPRVMKEKDGQAVRRIDADDAHLLSWDGSIATKEEDAKFIESGSLTFDSMEMVDLKVKVLDKDAAVVSGGIDIKGGKVKAEERIVDISGSYRFVDTFARRNNEWRLVASSSVKAAASATPVAAPTTKATALPLASPVVQASPVTPSLTLPKPSPKKPVAKPVVSPAAVKMP